MELLPLLVLLGIMYFLLIRPQQQRVKAQRALVSSLEVGDEVATIGGILGRILTIDDDEAMIETTPGTVLRVRRAAIAARTDLGTAGPAGHPRPDGGPDDPIVEP
ncbi:MAG TPA: preprotein translocase subunit YajC [Acidimicrobiales bacterium]|nr:preprotein translocase subunit YajC [Acidimicrobiales bacterium]